MKSLKTAIYYLVNTLCCQLYKREYKRFIAVSDSKGIQEKRLLEILKRNEDTAYGRKYGFKEIDNVTTYQERVPLSDYETYRPFIDQIAEQEDRLLTSERIIAFEPTSGSTKAAKLIPYTNTLKAEFQMGIKPWIYNLYTSYPEVRWGKSYWSITPITDKNKFSKSGIPIGFEEDSDYFGRIEKYLMDMIFVSPRNIRNETNMDIFYTRTVVELLKSKELTLISIWNPTYLLLLLDYLDEHKERLLKELSRRRQKEINGAVYNKDYEKVWPYLKVISCWSDAHAASYAESLKRLFPNCILQPKGLISTECFVSFPFVGERGGILSVYSHFYEFIDITTNKVCLISELKTGGEYEVVVTTGGGFYRYRTYDVVEVVGWRDSIPFMIFKRRNDRISDRFGEKLHEAFVMEVIEKFSPSIEFYMIAPKRDRYILYIKGHGLPSGREIDEALRESFHYDYCRRLGQLKELQLFVLTGDPKKEYVNGCLHAGQKLGDIKSTHLSTREDWEQYFQGYILEEEVEI